MQDDIYQAVLAEQKEDKGDRRIPGPNKAALGGEAAAVATDEPIESVLREQAYAKPSDAEVVKKWFVTTSDSRAVVAFCEKHPGVVKTEPLARIAFMGHLVALQRWQDVIKEADEQLDCLLDGELIQRVDQETRGEIGQAEIARRFREIAARMASIKSTALRELRGRSDSA